MEQQKQLLFSNMFCVPDTGFKAWTEADLNERLQLKGVVTF